MPEARAASTWSEAAESAMACRVTRLMSASAPRASDSAGSVRWCRVPAKPPAPVTGNQPNRTPNSDTRAIAATNDGTDAASVVPPTIAESTQVDCRIAARMPEPTPRTTNSTVA